MSKIADERARAERWKDRAVLWMTGQRQWRFIATRAQIARIEADTRADEWKRVARMWKRRCRRLHRILDGES